MAKLPLWFHQGNRQWTCKRKGKQFYFGDDEAEALRLYNAGREFYDRGMHPPAASVVLVRDLLNAHHDWQQQRAEDGEISPATACQWRQTTDYIADALDKMLPIDQLTPSHFEAMRRKLAKRLAVSTLGTELNRCRQVFNWGYQNEITDTLPRFGTALRRPPKKKVRAARGKRSQRLFTPEDVRALIAAAKPDLRAMILLAINTGMGPADIGRLEQGDISGQWLDSPRGKTGVDRRAWLWPETIEALEAYQRPAPAERALGRLVFLTRTGKPFFKVSKRTATSAEMCRRFKRLADGALEDRRGRGLYDLRRTHKTIASEAKDPPASDRIMGHEPGTMAAVYTLNIGDDRIQAVCEHVRNWLFDGGS